MFSSATLKSRFIILCSFQNGSSPLCALK
uniref:Uncharacterized protein n=1 Tax=Anguilla anguilla TaxID=7936 RepID=A0A0E9VR34_ANGAN